MNQNAFKISNTSFKLYSILILNNNILYLLKTKSKTIKKPAMNKHCGLNLKFKIPIS